MSHRGFVGSRRTVFEISCSCYPSVGLATADASLRQKNWCTDRAATLPPCPSLTYRPSLATRVLGHILMRPRKLRVVCGNFVPHRGNPVAHFLHVHSLM